MQRQKMGTIRKSDIVDYVEANISDFHMKRISGLDNLKLKRILKRKNPYLFKAKYYLTAETIVRALVDAHISSNEETIFGDWLEGLAIYINSKVYDGWKSGITGIDLEFDHDGVRNIVSIKSGPNWGNSSQINKMKEDFRKAKISLRTSSSGLQVVAINGCCYGTSAKADKGEYYKYCGQRFWEFISGDINLYIDIIEPLGHKARERNDEFNQSYSKMINIFTRDFNEIFCSTDGTIDWERLIRFNSAYQDE